MDALNLIFQRQMKLKANKYHKAPIYGAYGVIINNPKRAKTSFYVLHLLAHLFD